MDGIGGTIKTKVYRDAMSNKCLIKNAKGFAEYANKAINGITSTYVPINELLNEPDNIEGTPKIPETLSIHKVKRSFNEDNICFIDFFCVISLTLIRHVRFVKLSNLRRKRKKIGCNESCVNNGFTRVAIRSNLSLFVE